MAIDIHWSFQSYIPKINIKVLEGRSPAMIIKETEKPLGRALNFDANEYKLTFKSPLEKKTYLLTKQFENMS